MSFYRIEGGRPLSGSLSVQGAKNSVLPILAAAVLAPGQSVIHNCPDLSDVSATLDILRLLGCRTEREGDTVLVDASALCAQFGGGGHARAAGCTLRGEGADCLQRLAAAAQEALGYV